MDRGAGRQREDLRGHGSGLPGGRPLRADLGSGGAVRFRRPSGDDDPARSLAGAPRPARAGAAADVAGLEADRRRRRVRPGADVQPRLRTQLSAGALGDPLLLLPHAASLRLGPRRRCPHAAAHPRQVSRFRHPARVGSAHRQERRFLRRQLDRGARSHPRVLRPRFGGHPPSGGHGLLQPARAPAGADQGAGGFPLRPIQERGPGDRSLRPRRDAADRRRQRARRAGSARACRRVGGRRRVRDIALRRAPARALPPQRPARLPGQRGLRDHPGRGTGLWRSGGRTGHRWGEGHGRAGGDRVAGGASGGRPLCRGDLAAKASPPSAAACRSNAERFSVERFIEELRAWIDRNS